MKQLYIQTATQHPKSIEDEFSVKNQSNIGRNSNRLAILNPKQPKGAFGTDNREWQGTGLCKGPPGRPRSPGLFPGHPPDGLSWSDGPDGGATPYRVPNPVGGNTPRNAEIQIFKNNKFNYYSQFNFTIMKKYLFILILAVFASVTVAFGQGAVPGTAPRALACENDALHPIAGKPYVYTLDATPNNGIYTWWATRDPNFISTVSSTTASGTLTMNTTMNTNTALAVGPTSPIIAASSSYGSANAGTTNSVTITWSSSLLADTEFQGTPLASPGPTFVAAYYAATGANCADNFKAYELDPVNGFTVDILGLDDATLNAVGATDADKYTYVDEQCVDNVRSATYVSGLIRYDYGVDYLYYEVVAANFSGSYKPTFVLTGLDADQQATIEWDYTKAFTSPNAVTSGTPSTVSVTTSETNTSNGVSIYVRVSVKNLKYETLAAQTLNLAVAAQNADGYWDVDNNVASPDCSLNTETYEDEIDQIINERPTVVEGTSSTMSTNPDLIDPEP